MLLLLIAIVLVVCHIAVPSSSSSSISASFAAAAASESTASLARIVPPSLSLRGNRKSNSTGNNNNNNNNIIAAVSTNKNRSSTSADEEVDDTEDEPPSLEWFVEDTANFQQKFHVGNGRVFNDNEVKIIEFLMQSYTSNFVLANNLTSICPQLLYQHQHQHQQDQHEDKDKDDETTTTARTAALATLVAKSGNHTTSNNETTSSPSSSSSMNGRVSVPLLSPSSSELQEIIDDTISCECTVNSIKDEIPPPDETAAFTTSTTATVNSYVPSSSSSSSSSSSNTITRPATPSVLPVGQVSEFVNVVTYAARYASFICNMRHYTYLFQQYVNGHRQEVMDDLQKLGLDITGVEMAARIVDRGPPSPQLQQDKQDDP